MSETIPVLTFFNNKGGVGKTSLVYHTACMMEDLGLRTLVCDLDPQANLTASFLDEEELESLWENDGPEPTTIFRCVRPLIKTGDIARPHLRRVSEHLSLLPGDLTLSGFEQHLSGAWLEARGKTAYRAMRILAAFWQIAQWGCEKMGGKIILMDVGPNLGAVNRSALIASDFFVTPLGADVYSLQGLRNLGPTVGEWRKEWGELREKNASEIDFPIPEGRILPIGYVVNQPGSVQWNRPVMAYQKWMRRIPSAYHEELLLDEADDPPSASLPPEEDPRFLSIVRHYRSLIPMAQEAHKPVFRLTAADGAIGGHATAAQNARADFKTLTLKILERMNVRIPDDE